MEEPYINYSDDSFKTKAVNSSIKELIYESIFYIDTYSIALMLYRLNHEKYFLKNFNKNGWVDKTELNRDSNIILQNLKEDISIIIRNYFIEFNEHEILSNKEREKCILLINKLETPIYI
jgi:hypothetical protein